MQLLYNLLYSPFICVEGLRKGMKDSSQCSVCVIQDFKCEP
jgi:hypothetical protein